MAVVFLLTTINVSAQKLDFSRGSLDSAEIVLGYIWNVKFSSSDYDYGSYYGGQFGILTTKLLGIGVSYITGKAVDKVDNSVTLTNKLQFLDIYLKLPIPNIIELIAGVGFGNNDLSCFSDNCVNIYRNIKITKKGDYAKHLFIIGGVWVGKIYNLQAGFHLLNGNDFELTDESFSNKRTVSQQGTAFSAGLGVLF